jgi:MSHA biogenesis protein MshM
MYRNHFRLTQSPFSITPNPDFFYAGSQRGAILDALIYAVTHGEGIIKVTGEVGSGKTMLCRMLADVLPQHITVIYLVNPSLNREEAIYAIAGELDLDIGAKRIDEIMRLLQDDLIKKHTAGQQVVLLIEEAQAMPLDTLEEIRLFSNLETAHHKLLQIVLFGQPELDDNLSLPRMRPLKERITHSFKVPPLSADVIPEYLRFRMRAAGYSGPEVFSPAAVKLIAGISEGIVRRISILADKSLLAAFADNAYTVEAKHARVAIRDSEFSHATMATRWKAWLALTVVAGIIGMSVIAWRLLLPSQANALPVTASLPAPATNSNSPAPVASAPALAIINPVLEPLQASTTSLLQQRLALTQVWLSSEQPDHYTIQIMAAAAVGREQLERFLRKTQSDNGLDAIYVYPTRINDALHFGVVYGNYNSREQAQTALAELVAHRGGQPYLRTVKGIREEVARLHDSNVWDQ